jgi:hypothetical protein
VLNLETNTIVESCVVTFDETAPCPHDAFESARDKEMEESIFVDEEIQGIGVTKMNISFMCELQHLGLFLLPHLK